MSYPVSLLVLLAAAGLAGCATPSPTVPSAVAPTSPPAPRVEAKPLDEARLNEAKMLEEERRYLEATAIYEEQSKLQPENAELVARQAHLFFSQAREESDPVKAKSLHKQARVLAELAEKLGTTDPLTPMILASVRPDGSTAPVVAGAFSNHEQADRCIREGEEAFTRHDFARARECYQQAFALEPTNYLAALWTGDTFLSAGQHEPACEWYRKAIAVDPDNETGHRYLGDALAKLGRREEALNEWIAALLCQPYQRLTRQHFPVELRARAEARGRRIPRFLIGRFTVNPVEKGIGIDPAADNIEAVYAVGCAAWRIGEFAKHYPSTDTVRRSLPEEIAGLELLIATQEAASTKQPEEMEGPMKAEHEKWQPIIAGLADLKRDGLLEAYALLERADEELAKDYAAYRAAHRDKLERYVRVYWCGFE